MAPPRKQVRLNRGLNTFVGKPTAAAATCNNPDKTDDIDVAKNCRRRHYEERRRKPRRFQDNWKKEFPWIAVDDKTGEIVIILLYLQAKA